MIVLNDYYCPFCERDCNMLYVKISKLQNMCKTFCGTCGVFYGNEKLYNLSGRHIKTPTHLEGFIEYVLGV